MGSAFRRVATVMFALALVVFVAPQQSARAAAYCGAGESPQFRFGFAHLKELLGATMGQPVECEHANPDNGDTLQQTSTGLSFYRKATNTPTFINGWEHWAWTFQGLVYWTGSDIDPPGTATAAEPVETTPITTSIDANHGIALIKIAPGAYTPVQIGSSAEVGLAATLIIMGYPLCSTNVTATTGILSTRETLSGREFLQTDAAVNPGNSGGAALDSRGALIGIPVSGIVHVSVENTNFLIPIDRVRSALDSWTSQHRAGTLAPTTPPTPATPDLPLVYQRDQSYCANAVQAVGEIVPIAQLSDFVISYTVAEQGFRNTGVSFRSADPSMVFSWHVIQMSGQFYFTDDPSVSVDIVYSQWNGDRRERTSSYSGLILSAGSYWVVMSVLGGDADVWIDGVPAASFSGVGNLDGGNHLGLYCANFSDYASTAAWFTNVELWVPWEVCTLPG